MNGIKRYHQQDRLLGYLSSSGATRSELREQFGVADRDVLEAAAAGEELAADIVGRLRGALQGAPQAAVR